MRDQSAATDGVSGWCASGGNTRFDTHTTRITGNVTKFANCVRGVSCPVAGESDAGGRELLEVPGTPHLFSNQRVLRKIGGDHTVDAIQRERPVPRGDNRFVSGGRQNNRRVARSEQVYLATDHDRKGEAIAWRLQQALNLNRYVRVTFDAIAESVIRSAPKALR